MSTARSSDEHRAASTSVFVCHASEDKTRVRLLAEELRAAGFIPWLDEERLLGGQDWVAEISTAIQRAMAVVVCVSRAAISKRGFVQKELRIALDAALELPEGSIFIIPALFEKVELPSSLRSRHAVDLTKPDGLKNLLSSLTVCRDAIAHVTASLQSNVGPRISQQISFGAEPEAGTSSLDHSALASPDNSQIDQAAASQQMSDVRAIRQKLGITQSEFANSFGLPLATVRAWEQGKRAPDRSVALYLRLIEKYPEQTRKQVALFRNDG